MTNTLKMRVVIEVEYEGSNLSEAEAKETLDYAVEHLAGNGLFSEGTGMEVAEWSHTVEKVA